MQWRFLSQTTPQSLEDVTTILLQNRQISDPELFFHPPHPQGLPADLLGFNPSEVEKAVTLIKAACAEKKDILIFGDYDADGICATAVMWEALKSLGCVARPFIPQRDKHGYGMTPRVLEEIFELQKPDMIVSVDTGIVAHAAAAYAREHGVSLIISDHHQSEKNEDGSPDYPDADAIIHSTQLCGTTVAWVLARELGSQSVGTSLDLCGIATISDQVPLHGANRSFAYYGIPALQKTHRIGLRTLYRLAEVESTKIDSFTLGFVISPRINAMGRLAHGMDALRLLCTTSQDRAQQLATTLTNMNVERQDMTKEQFDIAWTQVQEQSEEFISIVISEQFHEGVIGLLAGRLVERLSKPALVMTYSGEKVKGSARSIKGVNVTDLLREAREHLLEVGGHPMAGGFSLTKENIEIFKSTMFQIARKKITEQQLIPVRVLECSLPLKLASVELCALQDKCAPFGMDNPKPEYAFSNLRVTAVQQLGKEKQHLKLFVEPVGGATEPIEALFWNKAAKFADLTVGQIISCAGQLETNTWRENTKLQIIIRDLVIGAQEDF
ncbi:single-stranded-DNA-specific exonuclease RecJ [Candidatus Woesebacteria bacterium]|nr:single-stranded-DNA-specific exonuclease RecJ [Candidatus Woesebacteria bacterium]